MKKYVGRYISVMNGKCPLKPYGAGTYILLGLTVLLGNILSSTMPAVANPISVDSVVDATSINSSAMSALEEEIPEEILRMEIITEARSPLTGEVLSAAEYAQLQADLAGATGTPLVSEDLRYLIFLLQFRRAVKPIIPFL